MRDPERFTLVDALVLVAAAALGFAAMRQWPNPAWCMLPMRISWAGQPEEYSKAHYFLHYLSRCISWALVFAVVGTWSVIALRLRRPRRRPAELATEPGFVACVAATLAMLVRWAEGFLDFAIFWLVDPKSWLRLPSPPFTQFNPISDRDSLGEMLVNVGLERFPFFVAPSVGAAVLVAFCWWWASGIGKARANWLDRTGRALGVAWLVLPAAVVVASTIYKVVM